MIGKKALLEFFKDSPTPSLVLYPDAPNFTIVDYNEAYLEATHSEHNDLIGKGIFEAFPYNDSNLSADGFANLTESLNTVIKSGKKHQMPIQKYDIPIRGTSGFELKYWEPVNVPLFDNDGKLEFIIHCVKDVTKQEQTEKQLKEFEYFFNNSNDFSCIVNTEGYFEMVNLSFSKILGFHQNEIISKKFIDFVHPDNITETLKAFDQLKSGAALNHFTNRYLTKEGELLWFEWNATLNPTNGKLYGIARDITERRKNKELIEKSNERYHYVTKATSDAIWDWDFEKNRVYRAEGFNTIFGFEMEALNLPDTSWENYIHPDDKLSTTKSIHDKINSSGNYWEQDYRIIKPNGKVAFVQDSAYIIRGKNNNVTRIIGAIKDITERKNAEEKLSKAADTLQNALNEKNKIMDSSLDIICVVDKEGYFVKVSAACEAIWGYKPEELIGKPLINYVYNKDNEKTQITAEVVMSGKSIKHFDNRYIRKDGSLVSMEWTARWDENDKLRYGVARDITDRKIAEGKIIESENRMRLATSSAAMGIWHWDVINDKMVWDKRLYQIYDIDDSELGSVYQRWQSRLHPEDKEWVNKVMQTAIADKKREYSAEFRIIWEDLSVHYIKSTGISEYDDNGKVIQMMGVNWDVTVEKEKEQHLKLLESVVTNTKDAVLITDAEPFDKPGLRILYVNDAFTKMTGYTAEEVIGKTPRILQGPKSDKAELKRLSEAIRKWQPCEITTINYKKNGEEHWVNFSVNPVANEKGEYTHWISIERDVTSQKKQEKELYITTLRLFDTLESIQDGFFTLDNNWDITYWNQEAEKISGTKSDYMIGKNFWVFFEEQISAKINKAFHKAKSSNKPIRIEVYSKIASNWYELNGFPSEIGFSVYFKNITDRKATESKLKKMYRVMENNLKELAISNQELEQFAYVTSHDLQEPLRMVTSFLSLIEKKYNDVLDEKGKQYIFFAVDGAKRMRQIILDLLEFSRVGKNESKLEVVDLNNVIEDITLLYRKEIEDKKAIIHYEGLPKIRTHFTPINQVFQNLISNSLKYCKTDRPPIITITCHESHNAWKFAIQDNGIGIEQEYFEKIFVIFQRLHNKEEYSGTGMGLAITKKIIENLKGEISLTSEVNQGTTFYLSIPKNKQLHHETYSHFISRR